MLNLFDYLTPEDNKKIENFIATYGTDSNYIGNQEYLKYWAKNNKKLFHLLGGQLIYKIPYKYDKPEYIIKEELSRLFYDSKILTILGEFFRTKFDPDDEQRVKFFNVISWTSIVEDKITSSIKYSDDCHKKTLQLQKGMKPTRAILKLIQYFMPYDEEAKTEYENFRLAHSQIFNEKVIKGNLCFSIHPLDFLTMSDNNSNWSSCMSWKKEGCYRCGTVEMMNSNNVICCYLESQTPYNFKIDGEEDQNHVWNNKKWRQLFYCTKEIIVSGKPYPYANDAVTKDILTFLRKLAETNWNHTYQFGIERYLDMKHINSKYAMEKNIDWIFYGNTKKHNIIFHTKGMYNDMLNDNRTAYWCVRNKVKKNTVITYSGKSPCLCCGGDILEELEDWEYDDFDDASEPDSYNARFKNVGNVLCRECMDERICHFCQAPIGTLAHKTYNVNGIKMCKYCFRDKVRACPDCGKPFFLRRNLFDNNIVRIKKKRDICLQDMQTVRYSIFDDEEKRMPFAPFCACDDCISNLYSDLFEKNTVKIDKTRSYYEWWEMKKVVSLSKEEYQFSDPLIQKHLPTNFKELDIDKIN